MRLTVLDVGLSSVQSVVVKMIMRRDGQLESSLEQHLKSVRQESLNSICRCGSASLTDNIPNTPTL